MLWIWREFEFKSLIPLSALINNYILKKRNKDASNQQILEVSFAKIVVFNVIRHDMKYSLNVKLYIPRNFNKSRLMMKKYLFHILNSSFST